MKLIVQTAAATLATLALSTAANAALISVNLPESPPGNDCDGIFGNPESADSCNVIGPTGTKFSPLIVKYNVDDDGNITDTTINDAFPSVDGSEFDFGGGNWSYTRDDASDPLVRYWVAKAGNSFNLFWVVAEVDVASCAIAYSDACLSKAMAVDKGTYVTPEDKALSHITFYDSVCTGPGCDPNSQVPLPAAAWLLLSGLAGLGVVSRRRKTA